MAGRAQPSQQKYDIVIVGGGVIGSSAAYWLTENPDFDGSILVVERDCPAYERYLKDLLGLDALRVIALDPPKPGGPSPIASRCCDSEILLSQFVSAARKGGRFQVVPHIGAGSVWRLAAKTSKWRLAKRSRMWMEVLNPFPDCSLETP